jgi:transcription elongation factor GreB
MELLEAELAELEAQHMEARASGDARGLALAAGRLEALQDRLASAKVVPPPDPASGKVAFGSSVTIRTLSGKFTGEERQLTIVGVDEARDETRIAFTAPIAQALLGHKVGEKVKLNVGRLEQLLEIVALED